MLKYLWYCHRLPDRSLFYHGKQFPVCARCTGIWIGYFIGLPLVIWLQPTWYWALPLLLPALLDGGSQLLGWRTSNNPLRLTTGLFAGMGEMIWLALIARWIMAWGYQTGQYFS